ncbi:MAG: ergothioneine biosynthesis protein EgtB [Bacteroidia bacterium]
MIEKFLKVRQKTLELCRGLEPEDFVLQPIEDVSPTKWHLAHTTWFFENFILKKHLIGYKDFHPKYAYLFNSYYESEGQRTLRHQRGDLSRPSVKDIFEYRKHVDVHMKTLLASSNENLNELLELGLQHEQQHQELLVTDLKYSLALNPLDIAVLDIQEQVHENEELGYVSIEKALYTIGFEGNGFCFDNELGKHQVYLNDFQISSSLVNNKDWLDFIKDEGYSNPLFWHSEGWAWVQNNNIKAPLYWDKSAEGEYSIYTLNGRRPINLESPITHISWYEAAAFAEWKGMRLPTEFEWEIASSKFHWGQRWEWTYSAYQPYPGYTKAPGALGEYNGKFMINQMVLRGASIATAKGHSRPTYRNFFHPHLRWQFTGLRLCKY